MTSAAPIRDPSVLLQQLEVIRHPGIWAYGSGVAPADAAVVFREREGMSFIAPATATTPEDNRWAWLELAVLSDLQAVGFLATICTALASANIPANAVSALRHDHLFVPAARADEAIAVLEALRGAG